MGLTNLSGPVVVTSPDGISDPTLGPSVFYGGSAMLLDPRLGYVGGGAPASTPVWGWGGSDYLTIKQVPSTAATNNIVNAQTGAGGTPLTLAAPAGGISAATVAGRSVLAIDVAQTGIAYGNPAQVRAYDPRQSIARALRYVSGTAGDTTQTLTVRGYDLYSQPMSEVITLNGTTTVTGKKAFKYVFSITPSANTGAISVGTTDIIGMPILVPNQIGVSTPGVSGWPMVWIYWGNPPVAINVSTGFLTGDTTSPATATTGDVRGTWLLSSASNNASELVITQFITPWQVNPTAGLSAATAYQGIFGVPQFT